MARLIDEERRERQRVAQRDRYANDLEYREKMREYARVYRENNAEKVRQQKAASYQRDKEKILGNPRKVEASRRYHLKQTYGITLEEYDMLMEAQQGLCAGCGTDTPGGRFKNFPVDHDHQTGMIRGLLCQTCNMVLGLANEDPDRLRDLADYLSRHMGQERTNQDG